MIGDLTSIPGKDGRPLLVKEAAKPKADLKKKEIGVFHGHTVYLVDGNAVRMTISADFIGGGNPEAYDYVPKGEIWVERMADRQDQAGMFMHEITEWLQMKFGGLKYEVAHENANSMEAVLRALLTGKEAKEMDHVGTKDG